MNKQNNLTLALGICIVILLLVILTLTTNKKPELTEGISKEEAEQTGINFASGIMLSASGINGPKVKLINSYREVDYWKVVFIIMDGRPGNWLTLEAELSTGVA